MCSRVSQVLHFGAGLKQVPQARVGAGLKQVPQGLYQCLDYRGWWGCGSWQVHQVWEGLVVSVPVFVPSGRLGSTSSDG